MPVEEYKPVVQRAMIPLEFNEILLVKGKKGTLSIVKAGEENQFFLETEKEEIILALEPEDLLVASGFGTDEKTINGLKCMLYIIREVRSPFIVLPKNHPASKRLKMVISAGNKTRLSCSIKPGTHPEQDILCGSDEFDGIVVTGVKGGVEFTDLPECEIKRLDFVI